MLVYRWLPFVINLFADIDSFKPPIHASKLNSFFNSVSTLVSNQVRRLFASHIFTYLNTSAVLCASRITHSRCPA